MVTSVPGALRDYEQVYFLDLTEAKYPDLVLSMSSAVEYMLEHNIRDGCAPWAIYRDKDVYVGINLDGFTKPDDIRTTLLTLGFACIKEIYLG